ALAGGPKDCVFTGLYVISKPGGRETLDMHASFYGRSMLEKVLPMFGPRAERGKKLDLSPDFTANQGSDRPPVCAIPAPPLRSRLLGRRHRPFRRAPVRA